MRAASRGLSLLSALEISASLHLRPRRVLHVPGGTPIACQIAVLDGSTTVVGDAHRIPTIAIDPALREYGITRVPNGDAMMAILHDIAIFKSPTSLIRYFDPAEAAPMNEAAPKHGIGVRADSHRHGAPDDIAFLHQRASVVIDCQCALDRVLQ